MRTANLFGMLNAIIKKESRSSHALAGKKYSVHSLGELLLILNAMNSKFVRAESWAWKEKIKD